MNRAKDIFLSCGSVGFTNLRMPNAKNFAGERQKVRVDFRNQAEVASEVKSKK